MKLHLGGQFSFYLPGHPNHMEVELEEPTRLNEILTRLGIPVAEISLAVVNGELVDPQETIVTQHDDVKLFPPVSGG